VRQPVRRTIEELGGSGPELVATLDRLAPAWGELPAVLNEAYRALYGQA
jgi:hypothetical protein